MSQQLSGEVKTYLHTVGRYWPSEREPVMDCCLVLTALSGVTINVSLQHCKVRPI